MEEKYNIKQMLIIVIIVIAVLGLFYGITLLVTEKKQTKTTNDNNNYNDVVIDYDKILAQSILSKKETEYFVFASFSSDEKLTSYNSAIAKYQGKENAYKVYDVDLDDAMNSNYVGDESHFTDRNIIFSETTLLKIESGIIVNVYQGEDIINALSVDE